MSVDLQELRTRLERLERLYRIGLVIHSTLDPQEALNRIVREAVDLVGASSGSVILVNPNTLLLEIHASSGLPEGAADLRLRVGEGLTGWVALTGRAARVGDVREDERYVQLRPEVRSELAVPLEVDGQVRGVLNVDTDRLDAFSPGDQEMLEALAVQAARVIHNTWLYQQLRLKVRLFEALTGVSQTINSTLSLDDALHAVTREACQLMQGRMCSLMLLDETGDWLDLRASFGAGELYRDKPRLSVAESLLGNVVRRLKPIQIENVQTSSRYQNVEVARREGLVSLLSVPLVFDSKAIGTLSIYTGALYNFSNEEVRILSALAELSAIAIHKAQLYERVMDVEAHLRQNERLSALGLLAAEVAHEIRNPLTVMKMLYQSLDLRFPDGDPRNRDVQVIGEKMDRLNKIVEQTLDFARTAEPCLAPVDLHRLVDELGLLVRHKLKAQNVRFQFDVAPGLPRVQGDALQLEQAFLNLMLNAVEAMPQGGALKITMAPAGAGADPDEVLVEFKDTGCGMSPERSRRPFLPMLTSTKARGTGLGLAIVQRVVESHRGSISIESGEGQGTTIRLCLPVRA